MRFSVVIANYNYGHMLSRAIDSVLNQTESDIEIIVVDDGSTDNSSEVIAGYQPRVRAYFQQNSGQSTAYNKGADAATGDYVLFLDADDELLPNAFEFFSEALKNHPNIDYLFAGYISVDEKGREKTRKATPLPATKREILTAYLSKELTGINNGGGIIKREVFESLRYPEGLRNNTDIVFLGQVLANKSAASIPQPVVKIHAHSARVRRNSKVVLDAGLLSVDALFDRRYMPDDLMDLKNLYLTRRLLSLFRVCYKSQSYGLAREYYRLSVAANSGTLLQWSYTRKFLISLFKKDNMEEHSSVLLQIRHSPEGLMDTCNQYLEMHSSENYRKIVVYLKGREDPSIEEAIPADKVIFLNLHNRDLKGFSLGAAKKLKRVIRDEAVTDVLAHRYKPIFISALATTYFVMKSMTAVLHGNGQLRTLSRKLTTRMLLKNKFRFVGVSNQVRNDLLSSHCGLRADSVFAVPLSIDIEAQDSLMLSKTHARKELSLDQNDIIVGHIGRLSPSKDQKTLLRAFAHARQSQPNIHLAMIGDGRCEDELKKLVDELGIENCVHFLGKRNNASMYIKAFDIFAMTSCDEGFGRVLLESMVAGCPTVATNIPAFAEVLGDSYDLFEVGDWKSIGEQISRIAKLSDKERSAHRETLKQRVTQTFSKQVVSDLYNREVLL